MGFITAGTYVDNNDEYVKKSSSYEIILGNKLTQVLKSIFIFWTLTPNV